MLPNKDLAPEFIQKIDWVEFKDQRQTLIDLQNGYVNNQNGEVIELSPIDKNRIEGLISLCDSIIDYAIDEMGLPEKDVLLNVED